MAAALARGAYAEKVKEALKEQVAQVLETFTNSLNLNAISTVPTADDMADVEDSSVTERVLGIIRYGAREDVVVRLVASTLDDLDVLLPVNSLLEVLCELVTTVRLSTLPLGHLGARPNTPQLEASADLALHVVVKYDRVSALAHYLVFLAARSRHAAARKEGKPDGCIHPHISKAIRKVHDLLKAPEDESNAELEDAFCSFGKSWTMSPGEVSAFHSTAKSWLAELASTFFAHTTHDLEDLAANLSSCTPKYSSFLNDTQYMKSLATKQLMNWPSRHELPNLTMKLYTAANDVKNLRNEWTRLGLQLPSVEESQAKVLVVLQEAIKAVAVMAGVEAVQVLQGPQQIEAAAKVLLKDALLPVALCDALKKVCAGGTGAAAAATPSKGQKRKSQAS